MTEPDDLSLNEVPYPPPETVRRVVRPLLERPNRYPDHGSGALVTALAQWLGVPSDRVIVGPGSAALCQYLVQALGPQRDEVVYPALSFEAYPLIAMNAGARPVPVSLAGYRPDLDALADAVTERTRCVLLCNPNNPTGAALGHEELRNFVHRLPPEVPVIVDEAYRDFATDPEVADAVRLHGERESVFVLRTFSKAHGLASLRVGYAVLAPAAAAVARRISLLGFPGGPGQAAALASLGAEATVERTARCAELATRRDQLRADLLAAGLPVAPSQANFLWLPLGEHAVDFAERCRAAGVLVRPYAGAGVRITVGTEPAHARLTAVARQLGAPCGS